MLRDKSNDLFHMLSLLESIGKVEKYVGSIEDADEFINTNDQLNYNATLTLLANISESLTKLSDETLAGLENIDLRSIKGMRNRIVHDYAGIDSFIVFDVVKNRLEEIRRVVESKIGENVANGSFDQEEYLISKNSQFYKHIRFRNISAS